MDRFLVENLLRLRSDEFRAYRAHLRIRLDKARDDCVGLSGEMLFRAQGRAVELKEQLDLIEKAPQLVDKLKNTL
jgi:hypothetical protein